MAALFTAPDRPGNWSLVAFVAITIAHAGVRRADPGHAAAGDAPGAPAAGGAAGGWRAVVRTALLCLLVPALLVDADGRGLHDRLTGTAVVRDR